MQFFLGILPLVAFYVGESYGDLKTGVLAALLASGLDLAYGWFVRGRINRLVLLTTGLVVVLSVLTLLSDDERFVLWSPVVGDGLFAALLGSSLLGDSSALEVAVREQDPDTEVDGALRGFFRGMTARLAVNLLVHAGITAWATTQSRETWLLVSGPVQYAQFALQAPYEFWAMRQLPARPEDVRDSEA